MKLTTEQIKQTGLAMIAFSEGKKVEAAYVESPNIWHDVTYPNWHSEAAVFRPKPQPVSRPWSKPKDVPLNCWIRRHNCNWARLVIMVNEKRISCIDGDCTAIKSLDFSELAEYHEYSTDRKTWHPCTVEDAQ